MPSVSDLFVSVGADVSGAIRGLNTVHTAVQSAATNITRAGSELSAGITVPIVGAGAAILKFGTGFEDAFTDVKKTVNATDAEFAVLERGLRDLATTPAGGGKSAAELAGITAVAGQLGIEGTANLLKFTGIAAGLSVATGIQAAQVGEDLARIAKLTNTPATAWENMASSIVALGNEMGGSERDIIEITNRLAGSLAAVGAKAPDILGIASAMAELGINPEAGGTAISKFFLDMTRSISGAAGPTAAEATKIQNLQDHITDLSSSLEAAQARQQAFGRNTPASVVAQTTTQIEKYQRELGQAGDQLQKLQSASGGGGNLAGFAKVAGVTTDQFKELVRTDPTKAFTAIISGLQAIQQTQGKEGVVGALTDIGVNDAHQIETLLKLANAQGVLEKALGIANSAWAENTALQTEVAKKMEATTQKWNLLMNQLQEQAISAWDAVRPHVLALIAVFKNEAVPRLAELVNWFKSLSPDMQRNALIWASVAAAAGPALIILGALVGTLAAILSPIGLVTLAVIGLAAAWATNFGDIQGKTQAVFDFIRTNAEGLANAFIPGLGSLVAAFTTNFDTISAIVGRVLSVFTTMWILQVTIAERAIREIGGFFSLLEGPVQAIATWINDHLLQPLLTLLKVLGPFLNPGGFAASLVGGGGGFNIGDMLREGELASQALSSGIAGGGPGAANSVIVNINNPSVPDQTAAERFAQQVHDSVINAMIQSERAVVPPLQGLPGIPF